MTDRELLEWAAKAAGITGIFDSFAKVFVPTHGNLVWSPLTDDGDALRLAVKIGYDIIVMKNKAMHSDDELCAATRRAIVRAAAEIGKEMK